MWFNFWGWGKIMVTKYDIHEWREEEILSSSAKSFEEAEIVRTRPGHKSGIGSSGLLDGVN